MKTNLALEISDVLRWNLDITSKYDLSKNYKLTPNMREGILFLLV